jgi:glycosyltransferase involved in cell wall biosynthesis
MRVLVVAEYYPRAADPVLGVWSHRQALAARAAGAEIRVLVLHRPLPPLAAVKALDAGALADAIRQPGATELDGLGIEYVRYLSPPRPTSYASWGAWAAPWLARAMNRVRASFPFDLVHAHYAVPAGDAVRRAAPGIPMIVSVHGGDVYGPHAGADAVKATLGHARLVLANSAGTAQRCVERGAREVRVLHLGTDVPEHCASPPETPTLVSVGHLIERKRHADVISALAALRERHPGIRLVIAGDGPERERLEALAASSGVAGRVQFLGQLPHSEAVAAAREATVFVLPSVDEAFGVAYIEAMAGAVPALGCSGEAGPEEIAAAGGGLALVPPRDPAALAERIHSLLIDPAGLEAMGRAARDTVRRSFTWERCGSETMDAYREVL